MIQKQDVIQQSGNCVFIYVSIKDRYSTEFMNTNDNKTGGSTSPGSTETRVMIDIRGEGHSLRGVFAASKLMPLTELMLDCIEMSRKENLTPEYEI